MKTEDWIVILNRMRDFLSLKKMQSGLSKWFNPRVGVINDHELLLAIPVEIFAYV